MGLRGAEGGGAGIGGKDGGRSPATGDLHSGAGMDGRKGRLGRSSEVEPQKVSLRR